MQLGPCRIEFQRDPKGGIKFIAEGMVAIIFAVGILGGLTYLMARTVVPYLQTTMTQQSAPQNTSILRQDFATANLLK
ncbi:hypothetical protein [Hoeflea alexandrii]|uniref:hypothetical protein n=1 Tax=Hoeflea alexandrii TaxID=288436 RepID=UPI0022AF243C|nr:hypothetical protein [Hoeflea alexandrii]MCZ4289710.1 hypothetical protein [Hoeflea alexandrii]